jgi:hypothetical protein
MRTSVTVMLVSTLVVVAFGLGGCSLFSHATEDANALITAANARIKTFQASDEKVRTLATGLNALGVSPADATTALTVTAQIKTELALQKTELAAASAKIASIKSLDVDATFKTYADLEVTALAAQEAVVDQGMSVYAEMDKLYTAIKYGNATSKLTAELSANISSGSEQIKTLSEAAAKAIDAANAYLNKATPAK